jgi:hypothetical protein
MDDRSGLEKIQRSIRSSNACIQIVARSVYDVFIFDLTG